MIPRFSCDYLNLSFGDVTIPTQVIKYNQLILINRCSNFFTFDNVYYIVDFVLQQPLSKI